MNEKKTRWVGVFLVGLFAVVTVAVVDVLLHLVAPPVNLREIDDSMGEYRDSDPTILVLGSSHARSFVVMDRELRRRTDGKERMLPVPVEWGKYTSYDWVLQHRIRPLLEETDADGNLKRPSLKRTIIVTEWWDSTDLQFGQRNLNLPARAWTWRDFFPDVLENGLTPFNGNYLNKVWLRWWHSSSLIQDRGHERIPDNLRAAVKGRDTEAETASYNRRIAGWREMVEGGVDQICDDAQMQALGRLTDYFLERGIEVTILLYPRMPGTLSDKSRATTLPRFAAKIREFAKPLNIAVVDMSDTSPLTDKNFENDFDHITAEGNRLLAEWALDGALSFLVTPGVPQEGDDRDGTGGAR